MPEPPPYVFFLSYARDDADEHLERFYNDLCENVRRRMGRSRHDPIGFRDVHGIKTGDHWPEELARALSTCQVFLPLYSPSYFNSEVSGKEWSAFQSRLTAHLSPLHPLILPILWLPLGARFEKLPKAIRDIQYTYAELGENYGREGLQYLLSLIDQKDNYQRFLVEFSKKVVTTLETHVLPPAEPPLRIEDFPNTFEIAEPPAPANSPLYRALKRSSRITRNREEPEGAVLREREFLLKDDFLTLVERVCRLREPGAQIERLDTEDSSAEYLRVSVRYGDIVRVYPVGAVEHGMNLEVLQAFCDQIDDRYRKADSGLISYLVYGGDPAPEGLLSSATRRNVRLMSFVEYQGLIDFRSYLRQQTNKLATDKIYPPSLYVPQRLWVPEQRTEHPDALARVEEWVNAREGRFILLLGEFGTGKTFLLHELARRMGESGVGPVPILLQMRSLEKGRSLDALLAQHFALEQMEDYSIPKFRYMLEQGRIVLLFDGFDELALRVTYDRATEHFDTLMEAAQGSAKVVVTSRRSHFLSENQVLTKLGERVELISGNRIGILQFFNRDQIRDFLVRHCGSEEAADAKLKLIDHIKDLLGLSENPRMLGFIADLPEDQLREAEAGTGSITSATLYRLLLERWLVFEYDRVHPKGAISGLTVEDRWRAVTALALRLWKTTERSVGLKDLKEDTAKVIRQLDEAFDAATATFQVGSGTLLVRDDEGNFSFLHQSILEWLIARAAAEEIQKTGDSKLLNVRELSPLMIDFLVSLAERETAIQWAFATRLEEISRRNALLILMRLDEEIRPETTLSGQDLRGRDFSGQDFSGAILEGANFSAAKFVKARLVGAKLKKANLREADLTGADLRGTDLTESDFSRARLLGTDLRNACLQRTMLRYAKLIGATLDSGGEFDAFGAAFDPNALQTFLSFGEQCHSVVWSGDGEWLAIAQGVVIRLFDIRLGREIRALGGHDDEVWSVAFSPDGKTLASASYDQSVRLWDPHDGREIRALRGHDDTVWSVAFSPDGKTLASASDDQSVRLWDPNDGREIRALRGHEGSVWGVAFSPDDKTLASASDDKSVRLWDPNDGREIRALRGHEGSIRSVAYSPDGKTLASASDDKSVRLWDPNDGREIRILRGHENWVRSVAFSPDGKTLASTSYDNSVRLWDPNGGREVRALRGHEEGSESIAFSPDGKTLASASDDRSVRLWDPNDGREVRALRGHENWVVSVAFSPDGKTLASASSSNNTVRLWDAVDGREIRTLRGHDDAVVSVAFSPDGKFLASASYDKTIRLWNTGDGREIRTLRGYDQAVVSVAFSPDGKTLASASYDRSARLWDPNDGREIRALRRQYSAYVSVAFSPDGKTLAFASSDSSVRLWDPNDGCEIGVLRGHDDEVRSVAFSPDGKTLASASNDKSIRLWDSNDNREIRALRGHEGAVLSVAFRPDSKTLASASFDNSVRLWDPNDGREIRALRGHEDTVWSVAFSPDGQTLASASFDNSIRLWDVATGRCIVILGHLPEGWVAFTPDGRYKVGGQIAGGFWHAINLCRFEVGELDEWVPGLRVPDEVSFFDLPELPPWRAGEKESAATSSTES